jgi:hypothetical protein
MLTRKQRVMAALESGSVCVGDVPVELAYTLRNGISDLRRDGVTIHAQACTRHKHAHRVYRYFLIRTPVQLEIPA